MAGQAPEAGDFTLIITGADPATLADAAKAFAGAFSLDPDVANAVLKKTPVIFAQKLTKHEVKAVTPKLTELSQKGLEFRLTARPAGKLPKLNWPVRPRFTAAGSGAVVGLAFDWEDTAFVCPSCGEAYQFKRVGKLPLGPAPAAEPAKKPSPVARVVSPPPAIPAAPRSEEPLDVSREAEDVAPLEPIAEDEDSRLPGEGEPLELPGAVEEIKLEELDAPIEEADQVELLPEEEEEPAPAPAPAPMPGGGDDDEVYNVFLSKIVDRAKQDKAIEMISRIKGIPEDEARELTSRLVIPIAKNVGKKEAEGLLEQFKKQKIFGRMTKAK